MFSGGAADGHVVEATESEDAGLVRAQPAPEESSEVITGGVVLRQVLFVGHRLTAVAA